MYVIKSLPGTSSPARVYARFPDVGGWVEGVLTYQWVSLKPPASWLEAQEAKGRGVSAATAIWYKRYSKGDRVSAWMVATDDDFRRAGYLE